MTSSSHQAEVRRHILADYDRLETVLLGLITNPGPELHAGAVVYGDDGKPVPNAEVRHQATYTLALLRDTRAALLGQDPGNPN